MSARNGDKSRHQINRKRAVLRRVKIRQLVADRKVESSQGSADSKGPTRPSTRGQ